ncbi:MAG: Do family serine endopeptidase [Candidatus Binataceae bacterium]
MLRRLPLARLAAFMIAASVAAALCTTPAWAAHLWTEIPISSTNHQPQSLPDFVRLAARLSPAVVNISTEQKPERKGEASAGDAKPDPFDQFGEPFEPYGVPHPHSLGSGFIINKAGYILTNDHVVEDSSKIVVTLKDGRQFNATIVGRDSKSDIALIKITASTSLPVAPLGDSDRVKVGQWVIAIGNPFGFDHTVTAGIVSAKGRFIPGNYDDFIQTDASINPGNSGGPLIDLDGAVVGVNSAIYTRTGSNMGIGFAIPVNLIKEELPELRTRGRVVRGWLGVYIQPVTDAVAKAAGLPEPEGAMVADVLAQSPAARSGVKRGDIILEYDHQPLKDAQQLPLMVGGTPLGQTATLKILRDRHIVEVPLTVSTSGQEQLAATGSAAGMTPFGIAARDLNSALARQLRLGEASGVVVSSVAPGSAAQAAGVRAHDIVLEVDQRVVKNASDFRHALRSGSAGRKVILLLIRRGKTTFFIPLKAQG